MNMVWAFLIGWSLSVADAKVRYQTLQVPFAKVNTIVSVRIGTQRLGKLGRCGNAPCPEPSWPGQCSVKEIIDGYDFNIICVSQKGIEALKLMSVELVPDFKFPDSVVGDMLMSEHLKKSDPKNLPKAITTTPQKWGKIHSWSTPTDGGTASFYLCPRKGTNCFKAINSWPVEVTFSLQTIKPIKL